MAISFTRKAYLEVWRDNTYISRHTGLIEAGESASRHADDHGSGDYYITVGGPPESFTRLGADGLPQIVKAGQVYYMARADVTIRFSESTPAFAYPVGAKSDAATSAVSANSGNNSIAVNVSGADVFGATGGVDFFINQIPNLSVGVGSTIDMSQYIVDGSGRLVTSWMTGLSNASYDPDTEVLTGNTEGTDTGVTLSITDE